MRLADDEHRRHGWRIIDLAADFELLDVWAFPIDADPARGETFARFRALMSILDPARDEGSSASRALFALRAFFGRMFGWDEATATPSHSAGSCWGYAVGAARVGGTTEVGGLVEPGLLDPPPTR